VAKTYYETKWGLPDYNHKPSELMENRIGGKIAEEYSYIQLLCWLVHFRIWAEMKFGRGGCTFKMKGRWMGTNGGEAQRKVGVEAFSAD
jgi:hypothetical protein